jgi:hypothetical protein
MRARRNSALIADRIHQQCDLCKGLGWILDGHGELASPIELEVIQCPLPDCEYSGREVCLISINNLGLITTIRHPANCIIMSVGKARDILLKSPHAIADS